MRLIADLQSFIDPDKSLCNDKPQAPLGTLGDYTLRRQIGRGGMGVVYEAWENSMDRAVALKVLPAGIAADPKASSRFMREAQAAGKLSHPSVVPVYFMGVKAQTPFYAMEFVEGETLAQILEKIKDAEPETATPFGKKDQVGYFASLATAFADVADGLQHAHSKGVIHRDVKPSNLILDSEGRLRILDFGLARLEGQESLTVSGDLLGTPLYMSPEQARQRKIEVDHRTDVYSLGATMYEALTWRPPFKGKDHQDTLSQIIERDPVEPKKVNARVPNDLNTIVLKCLRKDPGDRYGTAEALGQDLRRFVRGDPIEATPQSGWERLARRAWLQRWKIVTAAFVVALVLVASFFAFRQYRTDQARILREMKAEYEARVLDDVLKLQLARISLRERADLTRSFDTKTMGRHCLDDLSLVNAKVEIKSALADLEGAIGLFPKRAAAYYHQGVGLRLLGQREKARAAFDTALRLEPNFTRARLLRDAILAAGREPVDSGSVLETFTASDDDAISRLRQRYLGSDLEWLIETGYARFEEGDYSLALEKFLEAKFLAREALEPALLVGKTWYRLAQKEMAERTFRAFLDKSDSHDRKIATSDVARAVAQAYAFLEDPLKVLEWAEWVEPPDLKKRLRATALIELGRYEEALEEAREAVKLAPEEYRVYLTLGQAYDSIGEWTKGLEEGNKVAYDMNRTDRWVVLLYGLKKFRLSRDEEGLRLLLELEKDHPRWPLVHCALGAAYYKMRTRAGSRLAQESLREAIRLEPKMVLAHTMLADCLIEAGEYEEAHEHLDEVLRLDPGESMALAGKANAYQAEGKHADAIEWLRRDIEILKKNPDRSIWWEWNYTLLAISLLHIGKAEEARAALEQALQSVQDQDEGYLEGVARYPGWPQAAVAWAGYYTLGNYEEAARLLEEALALGAGKKMPVHYIQMGHVHDKLGEQEKAILRIFDGVEVAKEVGWNWADSWGDPLADLARWLRRDPALLDNPGVLTRLHGVIELLKKSASRDPNLLKAQAILYMHTGEAERAVLALEDLLELPNTTRDFEIELERCRGLLAGDLPSYASIDAALRALTFEELVARGAEWRFFRGTREPSPGAEWTRIEDDSLGLSWERGVAPIGYGEPSIKTEIEGMQKAHTTVFMRHEFEVTNPDRFSRLLLSLTADDGFIAYLNGKELKRVNVGPVAGSVAHDSVAIVRCLEPHAPFDIWLEPCLLQPGKNVLGIHGLNESTESSDALFMATLDGEVSASPEALWKLVDRFRERASGGDHAALFAYLEGRVLQLAGDHERAIKKYEQAIREGPERVEPWPGLAGSLCSMGRAEEAESRLRGALGREWTVPTRRLREAWLEICFVKLGLESREIMARLPGSAPPEGRSSNSSGATGVERSGDSTSSLRWLLDTLSRSEPVRINCGGDEYTSANGNVWIGDRFFVGGHRARLYDEEIEGTADDLLYQTERYFPPNEICPGGYRIPLPPARYHITLHLAERFHRTPLIRRFDVRVEGKAILENFEPLERGFATAYSRGLPIDVRDGLLDIEFIPGNQNPMISAIEIVKEIQ